MKTTATTATTTTTGALALVATFTMERLGVELPADVAVSVALLAMAAARYVAGLLGASGSGRHAGE